MNAIGVTPPLEVGTSRTVPFEVFFAEQHDALFRALCLVTGSRAEADDLSQEAFLRVWERWDRVSRMDHPDGYLFRTAMNLFRRRYRRAQVAAKLQPAPRRTDDFAEVEDLDVAIRALRRLTPQQRAALLLSEWFGYGTDEIAWILGCRATTVRVHISRGRAALRAAPDARGTG
jgi:RNA polymerase sigma-70 factor (ECF subfamily)